MSSASSPEKKRIGKWVILAVLCVGVGVGVFSGLIGRSASTPVKETQKIDLLFMRMGISRTDALPVPDDVRFVDLDGNTVTLSDFKGRIVFLNFWATWCPPCREEMPAMENLYRKLKKDTFVMAAVSSQESPKTVAAFIRKQNVSFLPLLDPTGKERRKFGVAQYPTTVILDKNLRIIGKALGPREWDSRQSINFFRMLSNNILHINAQVHRNIPQGIPDTIVHRDSFR